MELQQIVEPLTLGTPTLLRNCARKSLRPIVPNCENPSVRDSRYAP